MADFFLRTLILLSHSLSTFSLYSPYIPSTSPTFLNAAQTLTHSNHLSISLTLQLVSQSLLSPSKSLTIFAPPDSSFTTIGQPSLSLLKSHVSPIRVSIDELKKLPQGTSLPTLSSVAKLVITSSFLDGNLTINDVNVSDFAVYDDGSLVIYEIDEFFNSSSLFLSIFAPRIAPASSYRGPKMGDLPGFGTISSGFDPISTGFNPISPLNVAIGLLRIREYKIMASFLDMQLGFETSGSEKLTVFAPSDDAVNEKGLNLGDLSSFFRAHVARGLFKWLDLMMVQGETVLETFSEEGFKISVRRSGDIIVVNGVPVVFADIFCSDWLVIHGLNEVILPIENQEFKQSVKQSSSSQSENGVEFEDNQAADYVDSHGGTGRRLKQENSGRIDYVHADYDAEFEDNPPDYGYLDEPLE